MKYQFFTQKVTNNTETVIKTNYLIMTSVF